MLRLDAEGPREREVIEFVHATPLEYLFRWFASNDFFGGYVRLMSVIRWADDMISFGITQPQYHGVPAEPREIEAFFHQAGWTRLKHPSGHTVFFNYAFGVMAINAEKRKSGIVISTMVACSCSMSPCASRMNRWSGFSEFIPDLGIAKCGKQVGLVCGERWL